MQPRQLSGRVSAAPISTLRVQMADPRTGFQAETTSTLAVPGALAPRLVPRVVAALLAVIGVVGMHLLWAFFVNTAAGQRIDRAAFEGAAFEQGRLWQVAQPVLNVVSYTLVIGGAIAAVLIAVLRRRVLLAVQMFVLVGGANLTTQLVKQWYPRPMLLPGGEWWWQNSLPSGHTTVAGSVSAALLLAAPRRWRPVVAVVGAVWTIITGLSTLVGQWHRPADVVAAVFVVLAWASLVCAITSRRTLDQLPSPIADEFRIDYPGGSYPVTKPPNSQRSVPIVSWSVAGFMALLGGICTFIWVLVLFRLLDASPDVSSYYVTAYGGGALGVVGVTLLSFAILLVLRQATGLPRTEPIAG